MKLLAADDYVTGVRDGDRAMLAQAITLIESEQAQHIDRAQEVLTQLLPSAGGAQRVGISGVPGVGKSTFVDVLGMELVEQGKKVAVLAVDPSSSVSGGSILGDKTRMAKLSREQYAFIRPSPSSGTLGGVTRKTRETILLCEAAGFEVVLVETVGVGQSETLVSEMVDFYLVLMLAGAGDELQGIKRGILEVADMLAINKADGANMKRAEQAQHDYRAALHLMRGTAEAWQPPVVLCSALEKIGIKELWSLIEKHRDQMQASGAYTARRREQLVRWMWSMIEDGLMYSLRHSPAVQSKISELERAVEEGKTPATAAAREILEIYRKA